MGRQQQRQRARRVQQRQPTLRAARRVSRLQGAIGIVVLLLVAGVLYVGTRNSGATPAPATPTVQSLASAVDGVQCGAMEELVYHIHQHLTLYDHGKRVDVPASIGIPGSENAANCFYWIHVHAATPGFIHVESPVQKTFTLGTFFDIWHHTQATTIPAGDRYVQQLKAAAARGQVTAFYNGRRWTRAYRSIPLTPHAVITIEIGRPVVAPRPFTAWNGL